MMSKVNLFIAVAALIAGLVHIATKLGGLEYPPVLAALMQAAGASLAAAWIITRGTSHPRESPLERFAASWPLWLGLAWLRELFADRTIANLVLLSGFLCSASWFAGIRLAAIFTKRAIAAPQNQQLLPWCLCALCTAVFTVQPLLKYLSYYSYWMDLGYMLRPIWNTAHGRLLQYTALNGSIASSLSDHFSLIFLPLGIAFRLAPHPATLFAVQAFACAAGGVLLFDLWRHGGGTFWQAILIQTAYYLYAPLQFGMISDFHADPLSVPFICGLILAYERKSFLWLALCWAGSLLCKEHIGLAIAPLLLVFAGQFRPWRIRLALLALAGIAYTLAVQLAVIPFINQGRETHALAVTYPGGEKGLVHVVITLISQPLATLSRIGSLHNIEQLVWLFLPLLYIPFAALPQMLSLSLMLFKELYGIFAIHNHHQAYMAPALFWCVYTCWLRFSAERRWAILASLCVCCLSVGLLNGESPLSLRFWREFDRRYRVSAHDRVLETAVRLVPRDASVCASSHIAVHLFDRREVYLFPRPLPGDTADFVIFDRTYVEGGAEIKEVAWETWKEERIAEKFDDLQRCGAFVTIFDRDGVVVLKKLHNR